MTNKIETKSEVIANSIAVREQEIFYYQINIDNYTLALERIEKMSEIDKQELAEFKKQLSNLLISEKTEQKKAKLMLDVLNAQVI